MAKQKEGTPVVKDIGEVDFSSGQPAEIELDQPTDDEEVVYEGGPLDGQRGREAAEDQELAKKIEKKLEADKAKGETKGKETPANPDAMPTGKEEGDLPELEVDDGTGKTKEAPATADQPAPGESTTETEVEQPAYTPNLTYKAFGQEKQFPDWAKGLVKDAETEAQMRDVFSKADGLEEMKPKYHQATQEREVAQATVQEHVARVQRLMNLRQQNPAQFFEEMGVSEAQVLRHAREIIEAREDEARSRAYDARREAERSNYQRELASYTPAPEAQAFRTLHDQAVASEFAKPEVAGYRANFDRMHGQGAFDREIARYGTLVHSQQRRYAPPQEAVSAVMQYHGETFKGAPTTTPAPPAPQPAPVGGGQPAPQRQAAPARPKVMPRVGGNGTNASPTKQRLRSLDDVKKKVQAELS